MSPERSNSPQDEETVCTPKMSVPASPVAGTPIREAQSPISLLLAVAQSAQNRSADDDLTNLSWLQERDLLKGMNINPSPSNSVNSTPAKSVIVNTPDSFPTSGEFHDDSSISAADSTSSSLNSPTPSCHYSSGGSGYNTNNNNHQGAQQQQQQQQQRNKHPHNIPYDPLVHTNSKPPYSFSCLIFMAIEDSMQKALPVKEIYSWILDHFPYFKNAPTGWKNSVRHNLSLNKCFQKVEKAPNLGKGSLWTVDQQYKPNLIQALTRSPFHPCSTLEPSTYLLKYQQQQQDKTTSPDRSNFYANHNNNNNTRLPNPELYPYLSRKLALSAQELEATDRRKKYGHNVKSEASDESLDAVDAAAVMLSLKNGYPRHGGQQQQLQQQRKGVDRSLFCHQVITTSPSQDHTYSAAETNAETNEDGSKRKIYKSNTCRKIDFEDEEDRKIKEGAETLLNLAGISLVKRKRHASTSSSGDKPMDQFCNSKKIKANLMAGGGEYPSENDLLDDDDGDNEDVEQKQIPFKPRLLRTKRRAGDKSRSSHKTSSEFSSTMNNNTNTTVNNNNNNSDEWMKHRRELEISSLR